MDYIGLKFLLFLIMFMILIKKISTNNTDRDIILSPNKNNHQNGKILFYHPNDDLELQSTSSTISTQVPWEEALKYTMYLVLRDKEEFKQLSDTNITKTTTSIDNDEYEKSLNAILKAQYFNDQNNRNILNFGDIITLARGKFEKENNNEFHFEEIDFPNCDRLCSNNNNNNYNNNENDTIETINKNLIAFWMVEKIRQKDEQRGHRYELKITILPMMKQIEKQNELKYRHGRSFILRDNDYPKYFNTNNRNLNSNKNLENNYNKSNIDRTFFEFKDYYRKPYMFQNMGFNLNYPPTFRPELNVGEYYIPPPSKTPPQTFMYPTRGLNSYPNQYFTPKFSEKHIFNNDLPHHVRFPDSNSGSSSLTNKVNDGQINQFGHYQTIPSVTTTHLHHHYYLNKNKVPLVTATAFEKENNYDNSKFTGDYRGAIDSLTQNPNNQQINYDLSKDQQIIQPDFHSQKNDFPKYQTQQIFTDQIPLPPPNSHPIFHVSPPPFHMPVNIQLLAPTGPFFPNHQHPQNVIPVTTVQYMQPLQLPPHHHLTQMFNPIDQTTKYHTTDDQHNYHHHPQQHQQQQQQQQQHQHQHQHQQQQQQIANENQPNHFIESPKQENFKFSEPDPLYHHFQRHNQQNNNNDEDIPSHHHDDQHHHHHQHHNQNDCDDQIQNDSHESAEHYNQYQEAPPQSAAQIETPARASNYKQQQDNNEENDSIPKLLTDEIIRTSHKQINDELSSISYDRGENNSQNLPTRINKDYEDYDVEINIRDNASTHRPINKKYPDSINAQLPPPKKGTDINVPYVETSVVTQKSTSPKLIIVPSITVQAPDKQTSSTNKKPRTFQTQRQIARNAEKPILKWMPKRTKIIRTPTTTLEPKKIDRKLNYKNITNILPVYDSQKVETYITVTPYTFSDPEPMETITKQSYSTSISVQIGNKTKNLSDVDLDNDDDHQNNSNRKISTNKIEMVKADIKSFDTNSTRISMFKASESAETDDDEKIREKIRFDPIALSIVNHAKLISKKNNNNKKNKS